MALANHRNTHDAETGFTGNGESAVERFLRNMSRWLRKEQESPFSQGGMNLAEESSGIRDFMDDRECQGEIDSLSQIVDAE